MGTKIYLDDKRPTPNGWIGARWPEDVIRHLETGDVEAVSLDHDLGDEERTGYHVLLWIEEAVATRGFVPPEMSIHSDNGGARPRMRLAIQSILRLAAANSCGDSKCTELIRNRDADSA